MKALAFVLSPVIVIAILASTRAPVVRRARATTKRCVRSRSGCLRVISHSRAGRVGSARSRSKSPTRRLRTARRCPIRSGRRGDGAPRRSLEREAVTGIFAFALQALGRRKARSFALGGGLAFAVALVAAVIFMSEALRAEAERGRTVQPDIVVQRLIGGRPTTIPASDQSKLEGIASVRTVTPRVVGLHLPAVGSRATSRSSARRRTRPLSRWRGERSPRASTSWPGNTR